MTEENKSLGVVLVTMGLVCLAMAYCIVQGVRLDREMTTRKDCAAKGYRIVMNHKHVKCVAPSDTP